MNKTNKANEILNELHKAYKNPKTELENWQNPIQFMVCVILSAQATDKGVNKATPALFEKYKTAEDFANEKLEILAKQVSTINFYNSKAERIIKACKYLIEKHNGKLPPNIEDLIKIPGVGRKSANVIINEALKGQPQGVVVDTHITRLSNRLGLTAFTDQKDAEKIEAELMKILPKNEWQFYSNAVVLHGRYVCKAKNPNCTECVLNKICPSAFKFEKKKATKKK